MSYISLHAHTDMSNIRLLDSINTVASLIDYAYKIGLNGVAITDHEALGSHVKAIKHLEMRRKKNPDDERWKNFKLILGDEIYLCRNGLSKDNFISGQDRFYHFILLAKDDIGHEQIRELSSRAWKHSFFRFMERVPTYYSDLESVLGKNPGHVMGSTACLGGRLPALLMDADKVKGKDDEEYNRIMGMAESWIEWMISIFGEGNFFLEKQPSLNREQWVVNRELEKLAKQYNLPTIITTDAHYLKKEDRPIHKAYLNAKKGDREVDDFYASTYLMSSEEIVDYFVEADRVHGASGDYDVREVVLRDLENTVSLVGSQVTGYKLAHPPILPYSELDWSVVRPAMKFTMNDISYPFMEKMIDSPYEQDRYFIAVVMKELLLKYDVEYLESRLDQYYARIEEECKTLWETSEKLGERLTSYLLIIAKIVEVIWEDGDSLVGPGRGSSSGFLTNYLLGITQVDPLQIDTPLPTWRFMHPSRVSLADIDIDSEGGKRRRILAGLRNHFGGEERVVSVCTFGTEKSKSAINTAARGLGISDDEAAYIASMIPSERGFLWPLRDCFYGNEEEGRAPIQQFVNEMTNHYPDLWEVAQHIEGLICRRGIHACGVIISNENISKHNAIMKAPNGVLTTQFELSDTEYLGGTKFDLLSIDSLDKIRVTMELLIRDKAIEKKDTLRETYLSILNPMNKKVVEYDNEEIWKLAASGTVMSMFQFDTAVGAGAVKQGKPKTIDELAILNSLMRLMAGDGGEMPLDTYAKHNEDIGRWEEEMVRAGLSEEERAVLRKHLTLRRGVAESQESIMMLTMDPRIAGFEMSEADKLRKAVAKKKLTDFYDVEKLFYQKGEKLGTSKAMLDYVWHVQVSRQKGYSFSTNHTIPYSIIALQQLNLVYKFSPLYWNTANLIVDSGGVEASPSVDAADLDSLGDEDFVFDEDDSVVDNEEENFDFEEDDEEDEEAPKVEKKTKAKAKAINYGKMGAALGKIVSAGTVISPPDINKSEFTFVPDVESNSILFGIKGITGVNEEIAQAIIANRPYSSLNDLISKVKLNKPKIVNLIKSGALDKLMGKPREEIMRDYINNIAETKDTLNLRNMNMLIEMDMIPESMLFYKRLYNFNKYLKKFKSGIYYVLDENSMRFFEENYNNDVLVLVDDKLCLPQKEWDKTYTKGMNPMRDYIKKNLPTLLEQVNNNLTKDLWDKYARGGRSRWEMDSLTYYSSEHELAKMDFEKYGVEDFHSNPEDPEVVAVKNFNGRAVPIFRLWRIAGTVVHRDKTKNIVTIITPTGVVNVRIWRNQFVKYDKQISETLPNGKKHVLEKSWFSRGNLVMFTGIRRGDAFFPKVYKNQTYRYPVELITQLNDDGTIMVKGDRDGVDNV